MTNFSLAEAYSVGTDADGSSSDAIGYGEFDCGMVYIPNGSSITSLTWLACDKLGGAYEPAKHTVNSGVTPLTYVATVQTVAANGAYPIPQDLVGAVGIKAVANAAEVILVSLKSK